MVLEYKKRPKMRFRRSKEPLEQEANRAIRNLIITLAAMIAALTIAFIVTLSGSAQRGYTLQQEKQRNEALKEQNNSITTKMTEKASFSDLENEEIIGEMQQDEEKQFLTQEDNDVK